MTVADAPRLVLPDSGVLPRLRWTREQYHELARMGFIEEGTRFELVEGEIVERMTVNQPHVISCHRSNRALSAVFGQEVVVSQAPVAVNLHNEPEPDVYVLRRSVEEFSVEPPMSDDILLIVEVSDTTLRKDLGVKAALYARAGIPDYWVLNLNDRILVVHRQPGSEGYESITMIGEDGSVSPPAAPQATVTVADLLPPLPT
jgi:Uma2 family endonuclease